MYTKRVGSQHIVRLIVDEQHILPGDPMPDDRIEGSSLRLHKPGLVGNQKPFEPFRDPKGVESRQEPGTAVITQQPELGLD